jgi:hypothetical protein
MTITDFGPQSEQDSQEDKAGWSSAEAMRHFKQPLEDAPETPPALEPLPISAYEKAASNVLRGQNDFRRQDYDPAHTNAQANIREWYVKDAEKRLAQFSEMLIETPAQMRIKTQLQLHDDGRMILEDEEVRRLQELRIQYQHHLCEIVLHGRESFNRKQLAAWMDEAAGGNSEESWGLKELGDVIPKVAVYDSLKDKGARFGTVAEDTEGAALVVHHNDGLVDVDVITDAAKHSNARQLATSGHSAAVLLVVEAGWVGDLGASDEGKRQIPAEMEVLLHELG